MKDQGVTVGLIGLGGMANAHRRMISELDQLSLIALCDVNQDLLKKIGEEEGISEEMCFHEMEALISHPDVKAVISIVPNHLHAKVIELCIHYQKPIMAEKPFTLNFAETEKLAVLYEKQPIPCMVGFSYRYIPSFRYAKTLLEENKIGTIRHINVRYLQSFGSALFEVPYAWRFNQSISGTGALGDLGAHMIDSALIFKVSDNGCGMDLEMLQSILTTKTKGYGVQNVHQRVQLAYGTEYGLAYTSKWMEGTTVTLTIPKVS